MDDNLMPFVTCVMQNWAFPILPVRRLIYYRGPLYLQKKELPELSHQRILSNGFPETVVGLAVINILRKMVKKILLSQISQLPPLQRPFSI